MDVGRLITFGAFVAVLAAACSGGGPGMGLSPGQAGGPVGGQRVVGSGGAAASGAAGSGGVGTAGTGGGVTGVAGQGGAGGTTAGCVPLPPLARRVLALEPTQYGNATRDLLALPAAPVVQGIGVPPPPADLSIDASYLYALYQTAGAVMTQAAPMAAALAACNAGETDVACATRFAQTFGRRAFRRALDDVEVADMMNVFTTVCPGPAASCASPADFAAAIDLMIKAFILAPSFLYRTELGPRDLTADAAGVFPDTMLTADEVATQLGFMLLGSTPDAGLLAAAASGALAAPAGILSEVNRLLALPAAQANVAGLVAQWMGVDRLPLKMKDPSLLSPLIGPNPDQSALAVELRTSWDRSVSEALWSNPAARITDLLTSQAFFVDWNLAAVYGVAPGSTSASTFAETAWPTAQPRAGILTHPALLWSISGTSTADIDQRGQALYTNIVCQDPVAPAPDSSELDPYGRLLQSFDAVGNYRTVDEADRPIDSSATLTASSPLGAMTFSGPPAFTQALISSRVFTDCAVQRLFEAALVTTVPARDTCQVDQLRAQFNASDGTMASLLGQIAASNVARARAGGPQ